METRLLFLREIVKKSAITIKKIIPSSGIVFKEGRENFLTEADLLSQKIIIDAIKTQFPNEDILSEETESTFTSEQLLASEHLWVIDPIDGTNNFKNERNFSSISVGYVEKGKILAGVVYNFYTNELFYAYKGKGAYLNEKQIAVGTLKDVTKGVVSTETYYTSDVVRHNLEVFLKLNPTPYIMIRGCASLVICEIACGRTDLYFHTGLKPWDNAAAFLIAEESGAVIKGLDGKDVTFLSSSAVVGNAQVVAQFLNMTK